MAAIDDITAVAQSIYLAKNGRYNDVDDTELTTWLDETIDWINQFTQELELEADWNYLRKNGNLIATIVDKTIQTYPLPPEVRTVVVSPYRDIVINHDGVNVSHFTMVNPNQISNPADPYAGDRATIINHNLILSRPLKDTELGGELRADTIDNMPKLTISDATVLNLIKPQQLVILGVAKNATLPDIVQGGISPSLSQKYNDLLQKAVAINNSTAEALDMPSENFDFIRGVW